MNTKVILLSILTALAFFLGSCSDKNDDNGGIIPVAPVTKAFNDKYPNAKDVTFKIEGNYYVADFTNNGSSTDAWFTDQGQWVMEKIEYPFNQLPKEVASAFQQSIYASWKVDDSFAINRTGMGIVYKVEAEQGNTEMDLYYSQYGNLIKAVNGDNNEDAPLIVPEKVIELMQFTFAGSELLDIQKNENGVVLNMLDGTIYKIAQLTSDYHWKSTTWTLAASDVPTIVMDGFKASAYASDPVTQISTLLNADGTFYQFEVEHAGQNTLVVFDVFGQLVKADPM